MFAVGDKVGQYEILSRHKEGGMATLFVGHRAGPGGFSRKVAIKVVNAEMAKNEDFVRMFVDEAYVSSRIQHPNVVQVEELGEANGTYYLVMEYVEGCSLAQLLDALIRKGRRMSPELAVWIAIEIADGLHAAHETRGESGEVLGVVHRDVSPQNILIADRGHVKLIDFGIAKARIRGRKTTVGSLKGKLRYMSPEQAFGRPVDRRTDVYALGIVLWEMLVLRQLFDGRNDLEVMRMVQEPSVRPPSLFVPEIPAALDAVVLSALAKEPEARSPSALDLRRRLAEAMPRAAALDFSDLAELLAATMNEDEDARDPVTGATELPAALAPEQATVVGRKQRGSLRPGRTREQVLRSLTVEALAVGAASFAADRSGDAEAAEPAPADPAALLDAPPAPEPSAAAVHVGARSSDDGAEARVSRLETAARASDPGPPRRARSAVMVARLEDVQAASEAHRARASHEPAPQVSAPAVAETPPKQDPPGLWTRLKRLLS